MYTDYEEANLTVEDDSDGEKAANPKAVFEISNCKNKFLDVT